MEKYNEKGELLYSAHHDKLSIFNKIVIFSVILLIIFIII